MSRWLAYLPSALPCYIIFFIAPLAEYTFSASYKSSTAGSSPVGLSSHLTVAIFLISRNINIPLSFCFAKQKSLYWSIIDMRYKRRGVYFCVAMVFWHGRVRLDCIEHDNWQRMQGHLLKMYAQARPRVCSSFYVYPCI